MNSEASSNSSVLKTDDCIKCTSKDKSLVESSTAFDDGACGEPLSTQHLVIDFTPSEELDNEYVQRKICAFWELLGSRPDLQDLMVAPERDEYELLETTEADQAASEEAEGIDIDKTAVSMLSLAEKKGLIDRTFETKLDCSMCSLGSREYHETGGCAYPSTSQLRKKKTSDSSPILPTPTSDVRILSKKMTEWDAEHPKNLEPPGHPPDLSHCILQRNIV